MHASITGELLTQRNSRQKDTKPCLSFRILFGERYLWPSKHERPIRDQSRRLDLSSMPTQRKRCSVSRVRLHCARGTSSLIIIVAFVSHRKTTVHRVFGWLVSSEKRLEVWSNLHPQMPVIGQRILTRVPNEKTSAWLLWGRGSPRHYDLLGLPFCDWLGQVLVFVGNFRSFERILILGIPNSTL